MVWVLKDYEAGTSTAIPVPGIADREDLIVGSRRYVQRFVVGIEGQARRADDHSGGVGLVSIPSSDPCLANHGNLRAGDEEVQPCHGADQDVADEYLRL